MHFASARPRKGTTNMTQFTGAPIFDAGENTEGLTLREMQGPAIEAPAATGNPADRIADDPELTLAIIHGAMSRPPARRSCCTPAIRRSSTTSPSGTTAHAELHGRQRTPIHGSADRQSRSVRSQSAGIGQRATAPLTNAGRASRRGRHFRQGVGTSREEATCPR